MDEQKQEWGIVSSMKELCNNISATGQIQRYLDWQRHRRRNRQSPLQMRAQSKEHEWIKAFELLYKHSDKDEWMKPCDSPVEALLAKKWQFAADGDPDRAELMDKCISLVNMKFEESHLACQVLKFLLNLAGNGTKMGVPNPKTASVMPSFEDRFSQMQRDLYDEVNDPHDGIKKFFELCNSPPEIGLLFQVHMEKERKPAMIHFTDIRTEEHKNRVQQWNKSFKASSLQLFSKSTDTKERECGDHAEEEDEGYVTHTPNSGTPSPSNDNFHNHLEQPRKLHPELDWKWTVLEKSTVPECYSWETYGAYPWKWASPEKPYPLQSGKLSMELLQAATACWRDGNCQESRGVPLSRFVHDSYLVLIGVPTTTFHWDENKHMFYLLPGLYAENLCQATTASLCQITVFAGSLYRWLKIFSAVKLFSRSRSVMMETLKALVRNYLQAIHSAVEMHIRAFNPSRVSLISLNALSISICHRLYVLQWICRFYQTNGQGKQEKATLLLTLLCKESQGMLGSMFPDMCNAILNVCSSPYFKFLEEWLFNGKCTDTTGEFFIRPNTGFVDNETREYWSRGFELVGQGMFFFKGYEQVIIDCGKTVRLLLRLQPNSALFNNKNRPDMQPLLSLENFDELCVRWSDYASKISQQMGWDGDGYTVGEFVRKSGRDQEALAQQAKLSREKALERITKKQEEARKSALNRKKAMRAETEQHLQMVSLWKKEKEEAEKKADKIWQDQAKIKEQEAEEQERIRLLKSIEYYSEVLAEARIRETQYQQKLKRPASSMEDVLNANMGTEEYEQCVPGIIQKQYEIIQRPHDFPKQIISVSDNGNLTKGLKRNLSPYSEDNMTPASDSDCIVFMLEENSTIDNEESMQISSEISVATPLTEEAVTAPLDQESDEEESRYEECVEMNDQKAAVTAYDQMMEGKCFDWDGISVSRNYQMRYRLKNKTVVSSQRQSLDLVTVQIAMRRAVSLPLQIQSRLANGCFLHYLLHECEILSHFAALRAFFLFGDGVFALALSTGLFQQMTSVNGTKKLFDVVTMTNLLNSAVSASSPVHVKFGQNLDFRIRSDETVKSSLDLAPMDYLELCYHVPWPVNLVVTDEALQRYGQMFSFLLRLHFLQWQLKQLFHQLMRSNYNDHPAHRLACIIWHRLQHLSESLTNSIGFGLFQLDNQLYKELETASSMQEVYSVHVRYVRSAFRKCLLGKKTEPVLRAINKVLNLASRYFTLLASVHWQRAFPYVGTDAPSNKGACKKMEKNLSLLSQAVDCACNALYLAIDKLARQGYRTTLIGLLHQMEFNGYYCVDNAIRVTRNVCH